MINFLNISFISDEDYKLLIEEYNDIIKSNK